MGPKGPPTSLKEPKRLPRDPRILKKGPKGAVENVPFVLLAFPSSLDSPFSFRSSGLLRICLRATHPMTPKSAWRNARQRSAAPACRGTACQTTVKLLPSSRPALFSLPRALGQNLPALECSCTPPKVLPQRRRIPPGRARSHPASFFSQHFFGLVFGPRLDGLLVHFGPQNGGQNAPTSLPKIVQKSSLILITFLSAPAPQNGSFLRPWIFEFVRFA